MAAVVNFAALGDGGEMSEEEMAQLEAGELKELGEWKPGSKELAVMVTLAIISLMVALDATILVSVLPTLAIDLGGSANDAFWAGTSYLLACAVSQPFIAALSDIFGRKEMLQTSVLFFTMGTALCAPIAKNFTVFFIGRAIQGIGGGGIITMGQVIFADIVPLRQRPKYFSIVLAAWALGSVLGPLIGGLFVERVRWAWCFYINFPFCVLGLVLVPIYVKLKTKKTSLMAKLARVDWVGGFLFTAGTTSFLIGISWGGVQFPWKSAQVLTPIIVGVFGVVMCVLWERYVALEPILRPSLFHSSSAIFMYICALFQGLILFCVLYYIPFYFTAVHFVTPTQAGLDIFPVTCLLLPGSIVISIVTSRTGHFRWALWIGWAISSVACGLLILFDEDTPTPVWAVVLAVFGIGMGMLLTSINVGIQAISSVQDAGRAAAMYAFMRTLGMSIGVAIGGTTFQNVMSKKLDELGLPESIAHNSEAYVVEMARMDPTDPVRIGSLRAYVHGFHGVYWVVTGVSIAAFFVSFGIRRHSMDKILESKFVLRGSVSRKHPITSSSNIAIKDLSPSSRRDTRSSQATTIIKDPQPSYDSDTSGVGAPTPSLSGGQGGVVEAAAIAYYVEPGGKVTPVEICSTPSSASSGSGSGSGSGTQTTKSERQRQKQPAPAVETPPPQLNLVNEFYNGEGSSSAGGLHPLHRSGRMSLDYFGEEEAKRRAELRENEEYESLHIPKDEVAVHRLSALYDWTDPDSQRAREALSQYSSWSGSGRSDMERPESAAAESRPGDRLEVEADERVGRNSWS